LIDEYTLNDLIDDCGGEQLSDCIDTIDDLLLSCLKWHSGEASADISISRLAAFWQQNLTFTCSMTGTL